MTTTLRYAQALCEVAREQDALPAILDDMRILTRILDGAPEIRAFCLESRPAPESRLEFVELAFQPHVHELTARTLRTAAENGRLGVIPHLPAAVERVRQDEEGVERVILETVQPADAELLKSVTARMRIRLGREIALENRLNPDLLGGFRILWRDRLVDHSASGGVLAMKRCLTARV